MEAKVEAKESSIIKQDCHESCPLCRSSDLIPYHTDNKRDYCQCENCKLVFVPVIHHLSQEDEKTEYDKHDNTELTPGYRGFLNRSLAPLCEKVTSDFPSSAIGLDFGCGEGAFLSVMAAEKGLLIKNYDLYYHNHSSLLGEQYDYIVMTEVLEHIARPAELLPKLLAMLKAKGFLLVMTKRVLSQSRFAQWHYKQDPTHICFYSVDTFEWVASAYNLVLDIVSDDIVTLSRSQAI